MKVKELIKKINSNTASLPVYIEDIGKSHTARRAESFDFSGYYFEEAEILISGDTLFQDSIGRYDLPGGDKNMLFQSIYNLHSMQLPNGTEVVHGHGMATTIDWLHKNNPYFHK